MKLEKEGFLEPIATLTMAIVIRGNFLGILRNRIIKALGIENWCDE